MIETNTFGATRVVLAEYGSQEQAEEINRQAARLAVEAVADYTTPDHPRYVAGALGPTTKTLSVTGGVTFDQLVDFLPGTGPGSDSGGVDLLLAGDFPGYPQCEGGGNRDSASLCAIGSGRCP